MSKFLTTSALGAVTLFAAVSAAQAGEIVVRGSDSTTSAVQALAEAFNKATGHTVNVEGGGSSNGAKAAIEGEVDLAYMSRAPKEKEIKQGLVGVQYAIDGVAVIVNSSNEQNDFSLDELKSIYTGETTEWNNGKKIMAFNRPESSGTRECFEKVVMNKADFKKTMKNKHDDAAKKLVEKAAPSMYYSSAGTVDEDSPFTVCTVGGVAPTLGNIQSGSYPITRPLFFGTQGEATGLAAEFIAFAISAEGQAVIAEVGFVPLASDTVSTASVGGEE